MPRRVSETSVRIALSEDTNKPAEFRRYRQGLTTLYLAVAGVGGVLLTVSVAQALFWHRPAVALTGPKLSAENPNPEELIECNRDVAELLAALGATTTALMAEAGPDMHRRWEDFSRQWRKHYDEVDERCRFSELANTNMGTAYDRMARVHGDLPALRLKYQGLLVRFDEEQADEIDGMRRALDLSLAALEERAQEHDDRRNDDRRTDPGGAGERSPPR
jgi:hypothetical protein